MRKGRTGRFQWRGVLLTTLAFLAMVFALVFALSQVEERNEDEQTRLLEEAVLHSTLTCYAIEGRYPPDIEYLEENYGIIYDDERYIISIDSFASNLLPNIYVLTIGGEDL